MGAHKQNKNKSAFFKPVSALLAAAQLLISTPSYSYQKKTEGKAMAQAQENTQRQEDVKEAYLFSKNALEQVQKIIDAGKPVNQIIRDILSTAKGKISQNLDGISPKDAASLLELIAKVKTRNADKSINDSIMEMERMLEGKVDKREGRASYEFAVTVLEDIYQKLRGGAKIKMDHTDVQTVRSASERILKIKDELDPKKDVPTLMKLLRNISNVKDVPEEIEKIVRDLQFKIYGTGKVTVTAEKGDAVVSGETIGPSVSMHLIEGRDNFRTATYLVYNKPQRTLTCSTQSIDAFNLGAYLPQGQQDYFAKNFSSGLCKQGTGDLEAAAEIGRDLASLMRQRANEPGSQLLGEFNGDKAKMEQWLKGLEQGDFDGSIKNAPSPGILKEGFANYKRETVLMDMKTGSAIAYVPGAALHIEFNPQKWEKWSNSDIIRERMPASILGLTLSYVPLILGYTQTTTRGVTSLSGTNVTTGTQSQTELILSRPSASLKVAKGFTPELAMVMDFEVSTGGTNIVLTPYVRAKEDREPKKGFRLLDTPALAFSFDSLEAGSEFIHKGIGESTKVARSEALAYAAASFVASIAGGKADLTLKPTYLYMENEATKKGSNETGGAALLKIPINVSDRARLTITGEADVSQNVKALGARIGASLLERRSKGGKAEALSVELGVTNIYPSNLSFGALIFSGKITVKADIIK